MLQAESNNVKKIKVVVAAKQFLYRLGIKTIVNVIGVETELLEANSYENTLNSLFQHEDVDFLIINEDLIPMPKKYHLDEIRKKRPAMDVMLLEDDMLNDCFCCKLMVLGGKDVENCPCSDFVTNMESQKEIVKRFQDFFFNSIRNSNTKPFVNLSEREIEVLKSVAHGLSNKEIAYKLHISTNTVITHRKNLTDKLGIKTIAGLTVYAITNNIINPEDVNAG
ncbi:MAG: response regulator transcription factor [Cytophagales bacterium]|nr:response regulator transcription factor [Cytophagales bacterium]